MPVKLVPTTDTSYFDLGNTRIGVSTSLYGTARAFVCLNVHDDEQTAVDAAKMVLEKQGGLLIELLNDSTRLVSFSLHGKKITFDPNRMFTTAGLVKNLEANHCNSAAAVAAIDAFAKFILSKIPAETTALIALHNNTEGNLSIYSYLPGGKEAANAKKILVNYQEDPDDFFLTTDSVFFSRLALQAFNSTLQDNAHATDDGSLSILYGLQHKLYLNIEAQHGHLDVQQKMLDSAIVLLSPSLAQ